MEFIDRIEETATFKRTLNLKRPVLIVIYGRRRIGKSELIKHVLTEHDVYHLSEEVQTQQQIDSFAKTVSFSYDGFNRVSYHDWETVFTTINLYVKENTSVCLDEFSYLVKSDPSLPSVIQRLVDNKTLKYNLILCGSSQLMMHSLILNEKSPLYQRCAWQPKLKQLRLPYIKQALHCSDQEAVEEYAVWGGVPRYWELRADYDNLEEAVRNLLVNNYGTLYDEPTRLLRDERRDTAASFSLLTIVGNGVNRISEIAGRMQQPTTNLSQPISVLTDLGYVEKEIPFAENAKSSKKGLYRLGDNFLSFYYKFIHPNKYLIELDRQDLVMDIIRKDFSTYIGQIWEKICRDFVTGNEIDGVVYGAASRWWGGIPKEDGSNEYEQIELDVVAESLDKKHILVAECKWRERDEAKSVYEQLVSRAGRLPFVKKGQMVHTVLFLKSESKANVDIPCYYPKDIITSILQDDKN
jgi:AAA+ ATPase superfamily predicted ATPase